MNSVFYKIFSNIYSHNNLRGKKQAGGVIPAIFHRNKKMLRCLEVPSLV